MSLRGHIRGFRFDRTRKLFGSQDPRALGQAYLQLEAQIAYLKPRRKRAYYDRLSEFGPAAAICYRAIFEGVPLRNLAAETGEHMAAAHALARVGQTFQPVDFDDWKMLWAFADFDARWAGRLSARHRTLMHHLRDGRPLLGRRLDIDGAYYGYLLRDEAIALARALAEVRRRHPALASDDAAPFVDAVISALNQVTRTGRDVWFYAT